MKKASLWFCLVASMCLICFVGTGLAAGSATKAECVAKVKEAVAMVKQIGLKATVAKINDPKGPFQWKDTYVFCMTLDGVMLAHPNQKLIGKNLINLKDTQGKMYVAQFLSVAKTSGEGWVSYFWPKPGETTASPKDTLVMRVPGQNVLMAAGVYK